MNNAYRKILLRPFGNNRDVITDQQVSPDTEVEIKINVRIKKKKNVKQFEAISAILITFTLIKNQKVVSYIFLSLLTIVTQVVGSIPVQC